MDPASGLDGIRNVGIADGRIAAVSESALQGVDEIDATGLVVAPGFIDLHAHGQTPEDLLIKARDGVTTALELEIGVYPVGEWYGQLEGRAPINYGASVSGGYGNEATASGSSILGGYGNDATGSYSTVYGWYYQDVSTSYGYEP